MTPVDPDHVPAEDIDYAVENALWVARSAVTTRTSTTLDYFAVFDSQLSTHWHELLKLHAPPVDSVSTGVQQTLSDGGRDV